MTRCFAFKASIQPLAIQLPVPLPQPGTNTSGGPAPKLSKWIFKPSDSKNPDATEAVSVAGGLACALDSVGAVSDAVSKIALVTTSAHIDSPLTAITTSWPGVEEQPYYFKPELAGVWSWSSAFRA